MTHIRDQHSYAFITTIGPDGGMAPMDHADTRWCVAVARPVEGSLTERALSEAQEHENAEDAARAFIAFMREDMPGVLDTPNLRLFPKSPEDFGDALTDALHEAVDQIPEEDARDDDWDNTEFTELRDAVMEILEELQSGSAPSP